MNSTLGLAMIMKDEVKDLDHIIHTYGRYFDKVYVTVTHEPTYTMLVKRYADNQSILEVLELSYFEWCDHFGKARRFNQKQIKTDYWMWLDLDERIEHAEMIPEAFMHMRAQELDAVMFPLHNYRQSDFGYAETVGWRERIIKSNSGLEWQDVACHETITGPTDVRYEQLDSVIITHHKTAEQLRLTFQRNMMLLEKDWKNVKTPRTAFYLGACYAVEQRFNDAIEMFRYATGHGAADELKVRAWIAICDCQRLLHEYDLALEAADKAIALDPEHPEPWYQKISIYMATEEFERAADVANIALTKQPNEKLLYSQDLAKYGYPGKFLAAQAFLYAGNIEQAYELFKQVKEGAPQYIKEQNREDVDWFEVFEEAHREALTSHDE